MLNYDELSDQEKAVDYPEEFVAELRAEYHSGNEDEALTRAEEQGIDLTEIINWTFGSGSFYFLVLSF